MIGGALVRGSSGSIDPAAAALHRTVLLSLSLCLSDYDRYRARCCFGTVVHARPGHTTRCGRVSVAGYGCVVVLPCGGMMGAFRRNAWVVLIIVSLHKFLHKPPHRATHHPPIHIAIPSHHYTHPCPHKLYLKKLFYV